MSRTCSILVVLLAFSSLVGPDEVRAGELVDQIVAVVNKDVVLQSELDEAVDYAAESELRGLEGEAREEARGEIAEVLLESLVATRLMEQAMDRADIAISDRDLESAIADVASQNNIEVDRLYSEIAKQGMDRDSYRAEMRKQLRQYQFMNLEIRSRVSVTEEDIRAAYRQANANLTPEMALELQRILLSFDGADPDAVRAEAAVLLQEIQAGKDFSTVARARSDDTSTREKGGEAGLFKPADLSGSFAEALEGAGVGDVVSVELSVGVFLLRVAGQVDTAVQSYEAVRDDLARLLHDKGMDRELELWTQEERRRSHIEIFL